MVTDKEKKYGINVRKSCLEHEQSLKAALCTQPDENELKKLLSDHEKKLSWLMHERLIHLIVLLITVILVLFSMALILFLPESLPASLPMFLIVFVLAVFYVRHYFFLENTVQRWYMLDEEISSRL